MKKDRSLVFNKAKAFVQDNGLGNLTIRDLAQDSGVSIGTIYNMFGTKDNLIVELINNYWEESVKQMIDSLNKDDAPLNQLCDLYATYLNITGKFHKTWLKDLEGLKMTSEPIQELNERYTNIILQEVSRIVEMTSFKSNDIITLDKVVETIHTISINTNFLIEEDVRYYKEMIKRLLAIE